MRKPRKSILQTAPSMCWRSGRNNVVLPSIDDLAFGPILIRDGELNEEGLAKYGTSHAQRTAVGMVEKGHYWFMMLEGRIKRSTGDGISFLAERLMEKQCSIGFNLDGGDTYCIVFMGHQLCRMKDGKKHLSSRRTSGHIRS